MDTRSKKEFKAMITKDISNIHNYCLDVKKFINDQLEDTLDYLHSLTAEISQSVPGPSTTKKPKVLKKKGYHRKETIPENDIINIDNTVSDSGIHDKTENKDVKTGDVVETTIGRTKRKASIKAAINIEEQQSMSLVTKLRRLTLDDDSNVNRKRRNRPKKTKIADTVIAPTGNDIEELSICEDALEKFTPLMNSTMDINSTYTQKMVNATAIVEPLSPIKLKETVLINKNLAGSIGKNNEPKFTSRSPITLQEKNQQLKEAMRNKEFDELLTEDTDSQKKQDIKKRQKRQNRSARSCKDATLDVSTKPPSKEKNTTTEYQEIRNAYKSNFLFNPEAKVSVKKRVEAFERATRKSRRKTRGQSDRVASEIESSEKRKIAERAIAQKLARKLVEKAKKILLAKQNKDVDEKRKQEQRKAADEVMKTKHQMITSQPKYGSKQQGPTTYVLDSKPDDDESDDESRPKHTIPHWAQSHIRKNQLATQRHIPEKAVYKFFDRRKCTSDLTEMFENIDRSRLQRTSSAIWKTPPRYSMMENE